MNLNKIPDGYKLPESFAGKKPIHVAHASIADGDQLPSYRVLCTDGSYVVMSISDFVKPGGAA